MDQQHDTEDRTPITTTLPEEWFTEGIRYDPRSTPWVHAPRDREVLPTAEFHRRVVDAVSEVITQQGYRRLVTWPYARRRGDLYTMIQTKGGRNEALVFYSHLFDTSKAPIMPRSVYRVSGVADGKTTVVHEGFDQAVNTEDLLLYFTSHMLGRLALAGLLEHSARKTQRGDFVRDWTNRLEWELGITA